MAETKRNTKGPASRTLFHMALRRMRRSMTESEVAEMFGVTRQAVWLWMSSPDVTPRMRHRRRMAEYLDAQNGGEK